MLYSSLSHPLEEPGGDRLPAGGSGHALPGPHQAARARVCASGRRQGKEVLDSFCRFLVCTCTFGDVFINGSVLAGQKREGMLQTAVVTKELTSSTE